MENLYAILIFLGVALSIAIIVGFFQIWSNTSRITNQLHSINKKLKRLEEKYVNIWTCPECGNENNKTQTECKKCGYKIQ